MATSGPKKTTKSTSRPNAKSGAMNRSQQTRNDHSFSGGMHSLDSTQAPLRTSDGEPDWRGMDAKGGKSSRGSTGNRKKK